MPHVWNRNHQPDGGSGRAQAESIAEVRLAGSGRHRCRGPGGGDADHRVGIDTPASRWCAIRRTEPDDHPVARSVLFLTQFADFPQIAVENSIARQVWHGPQASCPVRTTAKLARHDQPSAGIPTLPRNGDQNGLCGVLWK